MIDRDGQRYGSFQRFLGELAEEVAQELGTKRSKISLEPVLYLDDECSEHYDVYRERGLFMWLWKQEIANIQLKVYSSNDLYCVNIMSHCHEILSSARHLITEQESYLFEEAHLYEQGKSGFSVLKRRESVRRPHS
ncbi:hypothetical protein KW805_03550 [Candidatus Pacearchaeota archaeon]|nr:hypothetical protein [Candidatus Pacearchaeota archaeon]